MTYRFEVIEVPDLIPVGVAELRAIAVEIINEYWLLLVAGWVCAVAHPSTAERIVRLASRLPDPKLYWPNESGQTQRPAGGSDGQA